MSNLGMEQALADKGVSLVRAKVGDRYVLELMKEHDWLLGERLLVTSSVLISPPQATALLPRYRSWPWRGRERACWH